MRLPDYTTCPVCGLEGYYRHLVFVHSVITEDGYTTTRGCLLVCAWPRPYWSDINGLGG